MLKGVKGSSAISLQTEDHEAFENLCLNSCSSGASQRYCSALHGCKSL